MSYTEFIALKSIFYFCSLPLRLDSYAGCSHGCLYCFSQNLNNRSSSFFSSVHPANPNSLEKLFASLNTYSGPDSPVRSCLKRRVPIHFGNVSDPFQPIEKKQRITYNFIQTLAKHHYPTVISTKSILVTSPEYLSILRVIPSSVQVSFSTFSPILARRIEPHAPSPKHRIRTIEKLANAGIFTSVRLQPFLYPLEDVNEDIFKTLSNCGVKHITFEHLRIPTNAPIKTRKQLWDAIGVDLLQKYREIGIQRSRINHELSSEIKLHNILLVRKYSHNYGMTFGAADNEFHHFSDSPCCCGIPDTSDFSNQYFGHIGAGLHNAIQTGEISFEYVNSEWQPAGSIVEYLNSDCRLNPSNTVLDHINQKISNPGSSNSPDSFFGIESDENGNYWISNDLNQLRKEELNG